MTKRFKQRMRKHIVECFGEELRKKRDSMCDYEFENYLVHREEKKQLDRENKNLLLLIVVAYLSMLVALLLSAYVQDIQYHKIKELEAKYQEAVEKINTLESERNVECPQ